MTRARGKVSAAERWRRLPAATRRHLTDYLKDDVHEARDLWRDGLLDREHATTWITANEAALAVLREAARRPRPRRRR